tara:strand:- start:28 stop:963 length:936 start_codon:yes stop_codon:yes gene_type:complete
MSVKCKVCDKVFETERQLHAHLKAHKLRVAAYYQKYFPRYDLYDQTIIKFKSKDYYFSNDFNSRVNQLKWLKEQPLEKAKEYLQLLLSKRKREKELIFSPCQIELRTVAIPSIVTFEQYFEDYYELCKSLGLHNKYKKIKNIEVSGQLNAGHKILIDSREKEPLKFNIPSEVYGLKFGDYTLNDKEMTCNCYIERKSLADFISTLSTLNYERFCREIERAGEQDANLIILVEESLSKALSFPFLPHISKKIKATPEFIFHNVRKIIQQYPYVQFLFVKGRKEAVRVSEKIFLSNCIYKSIDLQLAYDKKIL